MGTYHYSFRTERGSGLSRIERMHAFTQDASTLFDLLQQYDPKAIPFSAPLPDRRINLAFPEPLSSFVLEKLAAHGYQCRETPKAYEVSDQAAE